MKRKNGKKALLENEEKRLKAEESKTEKWEKNRKHEHNESALPMSVAQHNIAYASCGCSLPCRVQCLILTNPYSTFSRGEARMSRMTCILGIYTVSLRAQSMPSSCYSFTST
jgi:hypothetical protein